MRTFPCAKINLGLNIVEKRPDGYHNLETVFLAVDVCDTLTVEVTEGATGCTLYVNGTEVTEHPEQNLVVKAYNILALDFQLPHVIARLQKDIPMQAGMGGGSADAAFMLRMLNEQLSLQLTIPQLQAYAARLGADCAFFIDPVPSYATGIGEILTPLEGGIPALHDKWLALVKPNVAVSTKEAFAGITPSKPQYNCFETLQQPIETWRERLTNDFEDSIFPLLPQLKEVKEMLYSKGALYAAMSGSGSTVFGIFDSEPAWVLDTYHDCFRKNIKL